jgi:hypothetical protein
MNMKSLILASAALIAVGGAAFAQNAPALSSAAEVTLSTLAPNLDAASLSPVQVNRINAQVGANEGLTQSDIRTIVGH